MFFGDFKSKRDISLGGASNVTSNKDRLLASSRQERLERDEMRRKSLSKSKFESFAMIVSTKLKLLKDIDEMIEKLENAPNVELGDLMTAMKLFNLAYKEKHQPGRLISFCRIITEKQGTTQILLQIHEHLNPMDVPIHRYKKFAKLSLKSLYFSSRYYSEEEFRIVLSTLYLILCPTTLHDDELSYKFEVLDFLLQNDYYPIIPLFLTRFGLKQKSNESVELIMRLCFLPVNTREKLCCNSEQLLSKFGFSFLSIPAISNRCSLKTIMDIAACMKLHFASLINSMLASTSLSELLFGSSSELQYDSEGVEKLLLDLWLWKKKSLNNDTRSLQIPSGKQLAMTHLEAAFVLTNLLTFYQPLIPLLNHAEMADFMQLIYFLITLCPRVLVATVDDEEDSATDSEIDEEGNKSQLFVWNLFNDTVITEMEEDIYTKIKTSLSSLSSKELISYVIQCLNTSLQNDGNEKSGLYSSIGLLTYITQQCPNQKDRLIHSLLNWSSGKQGNRNNRGSIVPLLYLAFLQCLNNSNIQEAPLRETCEMVLESFENKSSGIHQILVLCCELMNTLILTIGDDEFLKYFDSNLKDLNYDDKVSSCDFYRHCCKLLKIITFLLIWETSALMNRKDMKGGAVISIRNLFSSLLRKLHSRNSRCPFMEKEEWIIRDSQLGINEKTFEDVIRLDGVAESLLSDTDIQNFEKKTFSEKRISVISKPEERKAELKELLRNIPFVIPFESRVLLFRKFVSYDRKFVNYSSRTDAKIRRNRVFEDGFSQLNHLGPNIKNWLRIHFIDEHGLEEAGIDGGGLFKEFLTQLCRQAFNVNFGLFRETKDRLLYPNPTSYAHQGNEKDYFEFLGRILGKALYEGVLIDAGFASFFLSKWLGKRSYINELSSLDKELYNGLIALKNYDGDVEQDFCLNFTIVDNDYGTSLVKELIHNGSKQPVTNSNSLRYIYLVSDYRLNRQIQSQCDAFLRGLNDIIAPQWLSMFNENELQVLVGGVSIPIDLEDLKRNTVYNGEFNETHPVIKRFWNVLYSLSPEDLGSFLRFTTSCSRPPLLGFSELMPKFGISPGGADTHRLPTSSTCINLLKLPKFDSEGLLKEKLLYAIQSGARFDLS